MATSSNEIERIVRKVLNEEQDATVEAVRELTTLLTEQVIPKLSKADGDVPDVDEDTDSEADEDTDSDEGDVMSMSAFGDEDEEVPSVGRRARPNGPNGQEEDQDANPPEQDVPAPVMDAFATLYSTLSSEQSSALAELFTIIDSELEGEGHADEAPDEGDEDDAAAARA
jgi:hypothetical protein